MDPARTPVLVGVGQVAQRVDDPTRAAEPIDLMQDAVRAAGEDTGRPGVLAAAEAVYVVQGMWRYGNPARVVAEAIGAPGARTIGTGYGGNMVQSCVNDAANAIARGELGVAVLAGAECGRTRARARNAGIRIGWDGAPGEPDRRLGSLTPMIHPAEQAHGVVRPSHVYAMFETAIRHHRGESLDAHLARIAALWARMSEVASGNPHAWIRKRMSAEEIATPSPQNRMIGYPYPKLMNSNNGVDMGGALVVCSLARAEALGIAPDRFVFPISGTDGSDHVLVSHRDTFYESPAIRIAGARALELAGVTPDDLDHVDLYSCFPSAVQVAARELGLSEERPLSVTGGLTFGGGPLNDYVIHSIATMAERLRAEPGTRGLVTANGGYLSKHAFAIYSTEPPATGWQYDHPQAAIDRTPARAMVDDFEGRVTIEGYTADYDADGPARVMAACRLPGGERAWATSADRGLARAMTEAEFCGRTAERSADGTLQVPGAG
jgi:acetyl-CoA C-acetyltransferase